MKKILILLLGFALFTACQTKSDEFVIKNKQVGKLTDSTTVAQMKVIYQNDSIVKNTEGQSAFEPYDEYSIIDKKSNKTLLVVVPVKTGDDSSLIKYIEIKSELFHTDKGINLQSNFGEISKQQKIGKVDQSFKYIVVYLDDLNATVNLPKDVLPLSVRNDRSIKMEATLIPDSAKLKSFVVFLNE